MDKNRLKNHKHIKKEIAQLESKLADVEAALFYPKIQHLSQTPGGQPAEGNPQEALAIYHVELKALYDAKLVELKAEQLAVEKAIEGLEPQERTLLRLRYLDGLTWEEICVKESYSWAQVHRYHAEALKKLKGVE